ncbi:phosphoethanolamine transferase [Acidovorax sp. NCPPB 3576]|uniref:phosphoethanolamine transferase n=1 Tax=Acidovorax sp. NCPPB 3576 TaxID=2940488 RepID=UPI00234AB2A9|nr:sulfatase-like hydrolase/transferase [Acidovorax sp. NCPPB 3576]WCM90490.1 sulfatase-like hydrolase/transferase [Acidovorax sp. NCPPB 3576]
MWLDNQSGCKKECARVPFVDAKSLCPGGDCFDEVMLHGLSDRLAQIDNEKRAKGTVIVLHQMGSHGPAYYRRSPDRLKEFVPECKTNVLKDCSSEELRNAYDNPIRYTDHFLAKTIKWLEANSSNSVLLYVSDHGESLGERNIYLHGLPYAIAPDYQKRIPWITWFSSEFKRSRKISTACLDGKADDLITHDNYFHSALGIAGVVVDEYVPALDVYRSCHAELGVRLN